MESEWNLQLREDSSYLVDNPPMVVLREDSSYLVDNPPMVVLREDP